MTFRYLAFLLLCGPTVAAQSTVPVSSEPRHHFKFENAYIRVYDVVVPPGDTTFFHVHAVDYTYVSVGAANLVAQALGSEAAPLVLRDGEVRFTKGPITHRVWNVSTTPFHNVTIELLHHDSTSMAPGALAPGDSLMLENDRVRVVQHVIQPGATLPLRNVVPRLVVYLSPGRVSQDGASSARVADVKPGTYLWTDARAPRALHNAGTEPLVLVSFFVK